MNKDIWQRGYGVLSHTDETKARIEKLVSYLNGNNIVGDGVPVYQLLRAADIITNAAMWLAVHQTYTRNVYLDGRELKASDFKQDPQGHLGGSLNMIPAYMGYMLANVLTGFTRSWVMGQGHAVAAIDSVNLLLNNMSEAHAKRYNLSDEGLSRFAQDFYSYKLNIKGKQDSPLGSHVNPYTAGGHLEGGYLGFASVQYVHMPLPGEKLVAFLSDGAFEEQRGADWAPRWWRAEDSGVVTPIMILNGRRIDQRSTLSMEGGVDFFKEHLELHGFEPIVIDGRDPAAFAWAILEQEQLLESYASKLSCAACYHIKIPYCIAVAPKGAGFYNEGTNYAHNLPLVENPSNNKHAAELFNTYAKKLYVELDELKKALPNFQQHKKSKRIYEREHPVANRDVKLKKIPEFKYLEIDTKYIKSISPMDAIDEGFLSVVKANNHLRPRVGNPDEMLSNRMDDTLKALEFRVTNPEENSKESILGKVITTLNEEAVAGAAFGNKGGINIVVTYEAFGAKMHGEMRQEIIFAKHKKDIGKPAGWLSVPVVLTSHAWENSKNELSHQDPILCEAMLSETSDISRVLFPADYNTALEVIKQCYQTQGQVWTVVVPKRKVPVFFNKKESEELLKNGAIRLKRFEYEPCSASIQLIAIGAYQLIEVLKASKRLRENNIPHAILYIIEPGKFRKPRNKNEEMHSSGLHIIKNIIPCNIKHCILVTHTRTDLISGVLHPIFNQKTFKTLGFINNGGTLGIDGLLFVNKCSWAHILREIEIMLLLNKTLLTVDENNALDEAISPDKIVTKYNLTFTRME